VKLVAGYQFEPIFTNEELKIREDREKAAQAAIAGRSGNTKWCLCNNCSAMNSDQESLCCLELQHIKEMCGTKQCFTESNQFKNTILNDDVILIARHKVMCYERNKTKLKKLRAQCNSSSRYLAYREFVYWLNARKRLGKNVRIVIPSCIVTRIRQKWPEESGEYVGFKLHDDEHVIGFLPK
jgi:hypothetical protein